MSKCLHLLKYLNKLDQYLCSDLVLAAFQYPKFLYAWGPTVRSQAGYRLVKSIKPGKVPFKSVRSVFMRSYCSRSRSVRFAFTQSQMKSQTRDRSSREWMINLWIHKGPFFHICTSLESKNRNSKARMHVTTGRECVCWNARYIKHTHTHVTMSHRWTLGCSSLSVWWQTSGLLGWSQLHFCFTFLHSRGRGRRMLPLQSKHSHVCLNPSLCRKPSWRRRGERQHWQNLIEINSI